MPGLEPGALVGRFQIDAVESAGWTFGRYQAHSLDSGARVWLAYVLARNEPEVIESFCARARAAASIQHPALAPVQDTSIEEARYSDDHGGPHQALELRVVARALPGGRIRDVISQSGPLPAHRAVGIIGQLAAVLDAVHATGVSHGGVRSENVYLKHDGAEDRAYLREVLAELLRYRVIEPDVTPPTGSLGFAPERIQGAPETPLADIYELGCVLHELLTGARPFEREATTPLKEMWGHLTGDLRPASESCSQVPPALDAVVARAMARDPADRYPTAGELARAAAISAHRR